MDLSELKIATVGLEEVKLTIGIEHSLANISASYSRMISSSIAPLQKLTSPLATDGIAKVFAPLGMIGANTLAGFIRDQQTFQAGVLSKLDQALSLPLRRLSADLGRQLNPLAGIAEKFAASSSMAVASPLSVAGISRAIAVDQAMISALLPSTKVLESWAARIARSLPGAADLARPRPNVSSRALASPRVTRAPGAEPITAAPLRDIAEWGQQLVFPRLGITRKEFALAAAIPGAIGIFCVLLAVALQNPAAAGEAILWVVRFLTTPPP